MKTYINPNMRIVEMKTQHMLALSGGQPKNANAVSSAMGRDYDFEDEEY